MNCSIQIWQISKIVEKTIPEIHIEGLTNKKGNIRKTVHQYSRLFTGSFGQIREQLVIEATWLGNFKPFTTENVGSYILDLMQLTGQEALIEKFDMQTFKVQVLSIERTFCEKIMSLVRFSRMEDPYTALSNKIRHVYDLYFMLSNESIDFFFNSAAFFKMLRQVGKDDFRSYKNNNDWLEEHPGSAIIFKAPEMTWKHIQNTYRTIFKDLVVGELPEEKDLVEALCKIEKRIKYIDWKI